MLRSAHIPLANEQGLLIGLSYQNVQTFNWESFLMFLSGSVAMYMKVQSVAYSLLTNDYQYLQYAWYSMTLFIHTWVSELQLVTAFEGDDASWVSYQRQRGVPHGDL